MSRIHGTDTDTLFRLLLSHSIELPLPLTVERQVKLPRMSKST